MLAVLVVLVVLVGCAGPAPRDGAGGNGGSMCSVGELGPCRCADGRAGLRVCGVDAGPGEIWGPCGCP